MKIVTAENYFEPDEYMSVSEYKRYKKCEVLGGSVPDYTTKSSALMIGSYVDAYVEGTLEQFKENNPDIFSSRGATKGELKADFKLAEDSCRYIDNNTRIQQFLTGDKQTIMTGVIGGVPFKIKMDVYAEGITINDLKVMRSVTDRNGNFMDFITPWGYEIQASLYQEIVRQNTGKQLPFFVVAVTKETPINSLIVKIPQHTMDSALYIAETNMARYYDIKLGKEVPVGCGVCKACIASRFDTPIISLDALLEGGYNV